MRKRIESAATRRGSRWRIASAALCLAVGSACAAPAPPWLPPLTQTPTQLVKPGKFVWVDLVTQDVAAAKSFYGDLFGWTFLPGDRYTQVLHDDTPIAGIVRARDPERGSEWVGNLSVPDVDRAAALVSERGGVIEREPVDAPDRGRLALASDSEGALFLLVRAAGGDPPDTEPLVARWLWLELWTHDIDAAAEFYAALVGYDSDTVEFEGEPYRVLRADGVPRALLMDAPSHVNPLWLPVVRVEDAAATATRAAELGARVVMRDERAAILVDPTGAPLGIRAWEGRDPEATE